MQKCLPNYVFLLCFLLLSACQRTLQSTKTQVQAYTIEAKPNLAADTAILNLLKPYTAQIDTKMKTVIGQVAQGLTKQKPESSLGNWMADITHSKCEQYANEALDFAICNYGGLRVSEIRPGPLTREKVFELMPFENLLVVMKVDATVVQQLFDHMADYGGWPISHTVSYQIADKKAKDIRINGAPLDLGKIYRIGVTDFLADGGNDCTYFIGKDQEDLNVLLRDAIMEFAEEETAAGRSLAAEVTGRVVRE